MGWILTARRRPSPLTSRSRGAAARSRLPAGGTKGQRGAVKVTRLVDMPRDRDVASGDLCRESAPLSQGSRTSLLVDLPRDEMALLIELVVHLGMN
jgi:hypothetical protein